MQTASMAITPMASMLADEIVQQPRMLLPWMLLLHHPAIVTKAIDVDAICNIAFTTIAMYAKATVAI